MFTAAQINTAIAQGIRVTAVVSDIPRPRQPRNGTAVTLTEAFDNTGRIRARIVGSKARVGVADVYIAGAETTPDAY